MAASSSSMTTCPTCNGCGQVPEPEPVCETCHNKGSVVDYLSMGPAYEPKTDESGKLLLNRSWSGIEPRKVCPRNCKAAQDWVVEQALLLAKFNASVPPPSAAPLSRSMTMGGAGSR